MRKENNEFDKIISSYISHPKVMELKDYAHHGINRYEHSYRVAYHTYKLTKFFKLNYVSATKAALLHDFFLDEVLNEKAWDRFKKHPDVAVSNAKKYFSLNDLEEDIIKCHMFPITFTVPKYIESWLVDFIDDYISVYERIFSISYSVKDYLSYIFIIFISIFRTKL